MTEYRACAIGADGHFVGCEYLVCANDAEAIEQARRPVGDRHTIELFWSGPRLVRSMQENHAMLSAMKLKTAA